MADSTVTVKVVPEIDEEALLGAVLAVISGHAVVKPGETLIIRAPKDWGPQQVELYEEYLDARGLPFGVLVVVGDELAVAEQEPRVRLDMSVTGDPAEAVERVVRSVARQAADRGTTVRQMLA
jgi:hypothetical protein